MLTWRKGILSLRFYESYFIMKYEKYEITMLLMEMTVKLHQISFHICGLLNLIKDFLNMYYLSYSVIVEFHSFINCR